MKKYAILLWLGLLAAPAFAQGPSGDGQRLVPGASRGTGSPKGTPIGGMVATDSTFKIMRINSSGTLSTQESAPIQDQDGLFEAIINNATIGPGVADSSQIMDTHALRHMKLLIKATVLNWAVADSAKTMRFVFQVRTHLNGLSDSNSVFAEYQYGNVVAQTTSATGVDSTNVGHLLSGHAALQWSGEFAVTIEYNRNAHGSSRDATGELFYYPSGIALSLDSVFGREFWSPYTSIRVRNITPGISAKLQVHLIGTPL